MKAAPSPRKTTARTAGSFCTASRNGPQLLHHFAVHRVQHMRPVEGDGGHAVFDRQQYGLAHAAVFREPTLPNAVTLAGSRAVCVRPMSCGKSSTMMQPRRSALKRRNCAASLGADDALLHRRGNARFLRADPAITPAFVAPRIFASVASPAGAACMASSSRPTGSCSMLEHEYVGGQPVARR